MSSRKFIIKYAEGWIYCWRKIGLIKVEIIIECLKFSHKLLYCIFGTLTGAANSAQSRPGYNSD